MLTCTQCFRLIDLLDASKSTVTDDISARMFKSIAYSIAPSLAKLFNSSLPTGTFPSEWKTARVVPIPKTDNPSTSVTNYRSISILSIISNPSRSVHQWGFMHHRLSTSALASLGYQTLPLVKGLVTQTMP